MEIQDYQFGRITIDGKTYTKDVKIYGGKIYPNWWRNQGHFLQLEDIEDIINKRPEVLVIGTGAYGVMKVDKKAIEALQKQGIEYHIKKSSEAVDIFNSLIKEKGADKVSLAIHLTC